MAQTNNAAQAYRSSYECKKMSKGAVNVEAHRMMRNPTIIARIAEIREDISKQTSINRDWVVTTHRELFEDCRINGNYQAATNNLRAIGESLGIYKEIVSINDGLTNLKEEDVLKQIEELMTNDEILKIIASSDKVMRPLIKEYTLIKSQKLVHES